MSRQGKDLDVTMGGRKPVRHFASGTKNPVKGESYSRRKAGIRTSARSSRYNSIQRKGHRNARKEKYVN